MNYESKQMGEYRYVYAIRSKQKGAFFDGLVKIDIASGEAKAWEEPDKYPGEPVFIPKPGATSEDGGVIVSIVLDVKNKNSFLLILDAETFKEVARATVLHHIPFGFHGNFYE
jgi:carotenoid cleavage dioxygenase-like enzyme